MGYKLVIAEKPSVGREIAKVLGANNKKDGYLEGNGYLVSWAIGHLIELAEPHHYDERLKEWSLSTLPFIPDKFKYQVNKSTAKQFNVLKSLINNNEVKSLINAGDCAREGQLIQDLIFLVTGCKKPIERLWISSLTEKDIREGFNNLKPNSYYDGLTQAAHARQKSDWICGINASRIYTIKASANGRRDVYSLGRVQTPTLALIVDREEEITNFVPQQYYQVLGTFNTGNIATNSNGDNSYNGIWTSNDGKINRLDKQEEANRIVSKVQAQKGVIDKLEKKLVKEKPPLLYDLTSLQRAANTKYGLTANQTLEIAQSLYEMQVLSYPRTSSQYLSTNLAQQIQENLNACNVAPYKPFVAQILSSQIRLTTRHVNDSKVTDHYAIIPTNKSLDFNTLDDKQQKVYDLVVRRFLSIFYPDAEIEHTTVTTKVLDEIFITKGKVIIKPGWQVVESVSNSKDAKEAKDPKDETTKAEADELQEANLPQLQEKQTVKTIKAEVLSKWTKPPSRYTEAAILGAMECAGKEIEDEKLRQAMKDCGLGTPATRASIIETLLKHDYIFREKKSLKPSAKGISLIKLLPCELLKSAELTASWEQKLNAIEKGNYSSATFLAEIGTMIKQVVAEISKTDIASKLENIYEASGENIPCPKCLIEKRKGILLERKGQYGTFLACSLNKDTCGYLSNIPKTQKQQKALLESRCPNCNGAMKLYLPKEKDKSPALFCIKEGCKGALWFNEKGGLNAPSANASNGNGSNANPKPTQETGQPCVKCGAPTVKRSFVSKQGKKGQFWSCSNWKREGGCDASPVWIN